MKVMNFIKGGKTIGIAVVLLGYAIYCEAYGLEVDMAIVTGLMGGGLWTLRTGIKGPNGGTPPSTTP